MPCEERPHPLPHSGTSQPQRALPAAGEGYVRPDERQTADWIVAAGRLAKHIAFFDGTAAAVGDWRPFFEGGETALLALLSVQDVDAYRRSIGDRFAVLKGKDVSEESLRENLAAVFAGLFSLTAALDVYYARLPQNSAFKKSLQASISTSLRPALHSALRYYKGALVMDLLAEEGLEGWTVLDTPVAAASSNIATGFSPLWTNGSMDWATFYEAVSENRSIYGSSAWPKTRQIAQAASHNLFTGVFDRYLSGYARLAREGGAALQKSLEGEGVHTPHYALFLAFLKLYRHAQDGFNAFGQRHLDFYYKDVLRLARRSPLPASAHLIIELAKNTAELLLPKDTLFKAGKDSAGKDVFYGLDEDTLVNRAKVVQISSLYRGAGNDNAAGVNNEGRLFYSPVSNSADGKGAEAKTALKDWHPYALRSEDGGLIMPEAEVGFAVASHYLFLADGYRVIKIKLPTGSGSAAFPASGSLDCFLTTEKGWFKVSDASLVDTQTGEATPSPCKAVQIILGGEVPPITAWDAKVHGGNFGQAMPVVKIVLRNEDGSAYGYSALQGVVLRGAEVEVRVGLDAASEALVEGGLKSLTLSNDLGTLDGGKAFLPFGPEPKAGSSFIIGSEEAFKKGGAQMQLRATWLDVPANSSEYVFEAGTGARDWGANLLGLGYLMGGRWDNPADWDVGLGVPGSGSAGSILPVTSPATTLKLTDAAFVSPAEGYGPYNLSSRAGFIRLQTLVNFGHEAYRKALGKFQAGGGADPGNPPYTPKLASLTLHYKAGAFLSLQSGDNRAFESRALRFYHIHPGGDAEQHALLTGGTPTLLPQFFHQEESTTISHAGELFIGLENLTGGQGVSLLIQVLEGTTDPRIAKPEDHVTWSYLSNNVWKSFEEGGVTDGTDGMIRSGIVELTLPEDATATNTLLTPGLAWVRASINSEAAAVARLLSIDAGAAKVSFRDGANAADFLSTPLGAGTIAKLKEPMAAVKKIGQPYASFGGRLAEPSSAFYQRAAERLRHRDRAIALWDYEHLILEAFPGIHRAKCLPHTSFAGSIYRENAPGHVTIVTIPSLVARHDANLLQPYTHEDTLEDIREFLAERMTAQATLHVTHPQFEEVVLHFKMQLISGLEFNFYRKKLQKELTQFLSPWAFNSRAEVPFGSRIHKSVLIDFIEERPYVDFITDVKMHHTVGVTKSSDLDEVVASTARSILVSAPAHMHTIEKAPSAASDPPSPPCMDTFNLNKQPNPIPQ